MKNIKANLSLVLIFLAALSVPAYAQLERANESVDLIINILNGISIGVATIAIMWVGYRYMFKQADIQEIGRTVVGALVVAGAAQLAAFFFA